MTISEFIKLANENPPSEEEMEIMHADAVARAKESEEYEMARARDMQAMLNHTYSI